jgi:succinylglutamic semialdehyde dehydrogenase
LKVASGGIESHDPANPETLVYSAVPEPAHVEEAVAAARAALPTWSGTTLEQRVAVLRHWQELTKANVDRIADLIMLEMGKVRGECLFEANALGGKVDITLGPESLSRVTDYTVSVNDSRDGHCRFKPHGVMAVIGPFNFPAHLPNGHWVPALLTGNTIVFKPSDKTPATGQLLAELMAQALEAGGAPAGVFNMVQGGAEVSSNLVAHQGVDGVLFTGSWPVGRRILEANLDTPGRIVALELGGSNPAVVMPSAHLRQAVIECARAAFATTGQRCTCTRRIIVHAPIGSFPPSAPPRRRSWSDRVIRPNRSSWDRWSTPQVRRTRSTSRPVWCSRVLRSWSRRLNWIAPATSSPRGWSRSTASRSNPTGSASVRSRRSRW